MKAIYEIYDVTTDMNGEEKFLSMVLDIDLEIENEDDFINKNKTYIEFNKEGKIEQFHAFGGKSVENPLYYIKLGKAVESIIELKEAEMKNLYDRAIALRDVQSKELNEYSIHSEYAGAEAELSKIARNIEELKDSFKRARKLERKEELMSEINRLDALYDDIKKNKATPYEEGITAIRKKFRKNLRELREETRKVIVL